MFEGKILITGGAGYLGATVARAAQHWQVAYTCFSRSPSVDIPGHRLDLDLRDHSAVRRAFDAWSPDVVVHTALSRVRSQDVEGIAGMAESVAMAAESVGARLIHISTEAVLDGQCAPYSDGAPPHPLTPYGAAKADAERRVAARHSAATVVRTSLIFGLAPLDKHTQWLVTDLAAGDRVRLFTNDICCPIWVENLAAVIIELAANREVTGHLNVAGTQPLSRWEFGLRMLAALGISPGQNLERGLLDDHLPNRPRDRTLNVQRATMLLRTPLLSVDDALRIQTESRPRPWD